MKLLLINAIDSAFTRDRFPPLGLGYLASYLQKHLGEIEIRIVDEQVERILVDFAPNLVGISALSQNFNRAREISRICKKIGVPVIVGGTHITALPSCLDDNMDFAVLGEGEQTLLEVVQAMMQHKTSKKDMAGIAGIAYRDNDGHLVVTPSRPVFTNLEHLPFPARDLFDMAPRQDQVHLVSSRGCPYHCRYCASTHFWKKVRFFSAEYVLEELKLLISKYSPRIICFYDDLFIAHKKRLEEIVRMIRRDGIHRKVEFFVTVRANLVNDSTTELLKRMNVISTNIGLESASERVLHFMKDKVSLKDNIRAVQIMKKHKLHIGASFIIGAPDETEEEMLSTISFIREYGILAESNIYILTPFPGTYFWQYAAEKNLVSENMDWRDLAIEPTNMSNKRIILAEKVSREKLFELYFAFQHLRKKAYYRKVIRRQVVKCLCNPVEAFFSLHRFWRRRFVSPPRIDK